MLSEFGVDGVEKGGRKPQTVRPNRGTEKEEWNVDTRVSESGGLRALKMIETRLRYCSDGNRMA